MKDLIKNAVALFLIAFSLTGEAAVPTTQEVWDHHIATWKARDLDGIVSDYSDESVVLVIDKAYRGKAEIKGLFQTLFSVFDKAEDHVIDPIFVIGKVVYFPWKATIDGVKIPMGTDTFFIEDGKILYQTITSNPRLF